LDSCDFCASDRFCSGLAANWYLAKGRFSKNFGGANGGRRAVFHDGDDRNADCLRGRDWSASAGTMPLIVALIGVVLFRERLGAMLFGLLLVAAGDAAIGGYDLITGAQNWTAHLLLVAGAAMWASFTIAYHRSGLSSLQACPSGRL
jgi:hypothetical protein